MDNKFELVFNERDDANELKNLPIDDNMHGIIEEEELDDEGSDEDEGDDNTGVWDVKCNMPSSDMAWIFQIRSSNRQSVQASVKEN